MVIKTYNIIFVRISNNTKIAWLEINDKHIIENADGDYETTVKASETSAKIEITLDDILAKVTLGGNVETGAITETTILPDSGDTIKTITVTAQDGTVATHKIIIHKQENDLGLDMVKLDGRAATKVNDTTFKIDVIKGTTNAEIEAIAQKTSEYVSINDNTETISSNTYTNCDITSKEVKIVVKAMFNDGKTEEVDQEKEYKLIITEIEEPAILEDLTVTIKVDGEIIKPEADGIYIKVVADSTDNSLVWAGVNSVTSNVKIKDVNGETAFTNPEVQRNISLQTAVAEVTVQVQNGAGTTKDYTLYIIKDSEPVDDAGLKQLLADDVDIQPESDGSYTVNIAADSQEVKLEAIANYEFARVSINGNTLTRGSNTNTISMGTESNKTIKIDVISVLGTVKQYTVNIKKEQDEFGLEAVYLDDRIASKINDTTFEIDVTKGTTSVDLKAVTSENTSYVQIYGNTINQNVNTYNDYLLTNGNTVEIKVYDATQTNSKTYTLNINEKTGTLDDLLVDIKVDGQSVNIDTDGSYVATVTKDKAKANVWAGANSVTTEVNIIDTQTGAESGYQTLSATKDIELNQEITEVKVKVKNGSGTEQEYTLYIVKFGEEMDDVSLESLYADGVEILPQADGSYSVEIQRSANSVNLVATATQSTSKVSINGNSETKHVNTETISLGTQDSKTIKIRVTSISGNTKEYTVEIHKVHEELELQSVYVDGRAASKTGDKEYTIDIESTKNDVTIEAISYINTKYVSIDSNTATVGSNIYNNYNVSNDTTTVSIKVLSEDQSTFETYTLIINKTDDVLTDLVPVIKVDGNIITPYDGNIYIAIVNSNKANSILWAGIDSETSKVKIDDGVYDNPSVTENVTLTDTETHKKVTVQNGEGTEKEYEVIIIKESSRIYDTSLLKVEAGAGATTQGEVTVEPDGTYSIEIEKDAQTLDLTAIANYDYAKVSIDGNDYSLKTDSKTIQIGTEETKTIMIKVQSVSGAVKNYIVKIYRFWTEINLC